MITKMEDVWEDDGQIEGSSNKPFQKTEILCYILMSLICFSRDDVFSSTLEKLTFVWRYISDKIKYFTPCIFDLLTSLIYRVLYTFYKIFLVWKDPYVRFLFNRGIK